LPFGIETALDAALEQSRIALLAAQSNLMNADNQVNSRWNSLQAAAEALETANAGNDANAKTEAQATYDAAQINYNNAVSNRNLAQQELSAAQAAYDAAAAAASRSGALVSVWRGNGLADDGTDKYLLDLRHSECGRQALGYNGEKPEGFVAAVQLDSTVSSLPVAADNLSHFITDSDGDGLPNWLEAAMGLNPRNGGDATTDSDGDGLYDAYEILAGISPWNSMTDGTTLDAQRVQSFTFAGVTTEFTYLALQELNFSPLAESGADTDDDGLSDWEELVKRSRHISALSPYFSRVLKITDAALELPLPNTAAYALDGSFTLELWLKLASLPAPGEEATLLSRVVTSQGVEYVNYALGISDTGYPQFGFSSSEGFNASLTGLRKISLDKWTHLAAVYEQGSKRLTLYLDDVQVGEVSYAGIDIAFQQVGQASQHIGKGFQGSIEALRIWNYAKAGFADRFDSANHALFGYVPAGLQASFIFDDGGDSAQNYALPQSDWFNAWSNAMQMQTGAELAIDENSPVLAEADDSLDSDQNGLPDWWEMEHFGHINVDPQADADGDGLSNLYEFLCGTDPVNSTDKSDYNALSADGVMSNAEKQFYGLDPRLADTDADGISDADEVESFLKRLGLEGKTIAQLKANVLVRSLISKEEFGPRNPLVTDYEDELKVLHFNAAGSGLTVPAQYRHALQDWTLMARVKTSAGGGTLLSRSLGAGLNYELGLDGLVPYARLLAADGVEELEAKDTNIAIEADTWTHLAATYSADSGTLTLYADGMAIAQTIDDEFVAPLYADSPELTLGKGYKGDMDDLRIYSEALSQEEIFAQVRAVESGDYAAALPFGIETALDAA
ncbi:MAG: LamG-like jellyroll fold domain-containing protein, partial [Lentisphaeria bacterium]|nr:LamG-like jellyroll fold domain-containing protein [Lentisphaeria bacterium]